MGIRWREWSSVSQGSSTPGAPITAVPYGDGIAVFLADPNGGVYFTVGHPDRGWDGWAPVLNRMTTPGARITPIPAGDLIALFVTDANGEVFSVVGTPDSTWNDWHTAAQGSSIPGAPVCAVPYGNRIALFIADPSGGLYTTAGYPQNPVWGGSWATVRDGRSTPGAPITAVPYGDRFAVFLADPNGGVYFGDGTPDLNWELWRTAAEGSTTPGAPICAVPYGNRIALFIANPSGGVYTTAGYPQNPVWGGSWATVSEGRSAPGAPIAVVPYGEQFAVFLADPNGGVYFNTGTPDANWGAWTLIEGLRCAPGAHITVAPLGARLVVLMTDDKGEVHVTSTVPVLRKAEIKFDTHDENKDAPTLVHVFIKNRSNNSTTPEPGTDYLSNFLRLKRYQAYGDLTQGEHNPYLAFGYGLGFGSSFDNPSSRTFTLQLASDDISVDDVVLPQAEIHILADGDDRWIFDYTVTLSFDNGPLTFTSTVDGVRGIILDQDNRNHSGIGIENGELRTLPIPVPAKPITDAVLTKVTLQVHTHNDNKDWDTRLNVHIANRLDAGTAQDMAIGLDLFHDQEFPDSTDVYREFSWENGSLASTSIRLADIVLPMVYIVIEPNGNDRWIFDYQITFEFVDLQNFNQKPYVFSSKTSGLVLDQDNNKHAGAYQGNPFPTVTPPTAPGLTNQPVDHTGGHHKVISIPFLRQKFGEFVNNRNDDPLIKLWLGCSIDYLNPPAPDRPLPESYYDLQSLINGDDGMVHYIHNPKSAGQLKKAWSLLDSFLSDINSGTLELSVDPLSPTPITLKVGFQSGGVGLWEGSHLNNVTFDQFSIAIALTLDKKTFTDQFAKTYTVIDLMSWVDELNEMTTAALPGLPHDPQRYLYTGTFLHQPVDKISAASKNDLFVEQVIKVSLTTDGHLDPGELIRTNIRDAIYSKLTDPDVLSNTTVRDDLNSSVTSWLLGGVADDQKNTDENNAAINRVEIKSAGSAADIPDDSVVIDYTGPRNVFVPKMPADWPTAYDFSPSALNNINHIVVLTMENRSFDHMLGYLSLPVGLGGMGRSDVDGLKGTESNPYNGKNFPVFPLTATRFVPGPPNAYESVHQAINGGKMDGFVRSYAEESSDDVAGQVMGYHTLVTVPVYDALARDFAIGHRWFASHPGPTFPNRFYELSGRPNLDTRGFWEFQNSSPIRPVFTPTIFDYLTDSMHHPIVDPITGAPVTWRYFEHGYCTLRFFEQHTFDNENIVDFDDPANGFFACTHTNRLPSVSFIDPHFVDYPPGSNCDEPPGDVANGQAFVRSVVEAIVGSPAWSQTLLLVVYDEHGGFYDHVPPPEAPRVSDDLPISTFGLRVPAFVISPWVAAGSVFGYDSDLTNPASPSPFTAAGSGNHRDLHFDHTSILKTIVRRFLSNNPPPLGAGYAAANDLSAVLTAQPREQQFAPFIPYRFQFLGSGMMMDVQGANPAPGTPLWQFGPNNTNAQDFSFEEAGGGFVRIRSHVSHLYVTLAVRFTVPTQPASLQIIQDVKYDSSSGAGIPERQRWQLKNVGADGQGRLYEISSEAYPNLRLRPRDPSVFESEIALVDPAVSSGDVRWRVRSPVTG